VNSPMLRVRATQAYPCRHACHTSDAPYSHLKPCCHYCEICDDQVVLCPHDVDRPLPRMSTHAA